MIGVVKAPAGRKLEKNCDTREKNQEERGEAGAAAISIRERVGGVVVFFGFLFGSYRENKERERERGERAGGTGRCVCVRESHQRPCIAVRCWVPAVQTRSRLFGPRTSKAKVAPA